MQVHSVISNTISEEILRTGHLSIRFMVDGFSLLLEDRSFNPVLLNRFTQESPMTLKSHLLECKDWLERHTLISAFTGEVTILDDSIPSTLVPDELFSDHNAFLFLEPVTSLRAGEKVFHKDIRNRPFTLVYAVQNDLRDLAALFAGIARIKPSLEILLSVADQVNASDHQRGFALAEVQNGFFGILIIKDDELVILNSFHINQSDEMVYHTLNTMQQLEFDRNSRPLFLGGPEMNTQIDELGKYIRSIQPLPYHINDLDGSSVQEHILLAEATRCE